MKSGVNSSVAVGRFKATDWRHFSNGVYSHILTHQFQLDKCKLKFTLEIIGNMRYDINIMSLTTRRILYIIFIIAFLIIAPMTLFYAAGYKFSLKGVKLQKTGAFILDSEPRGAKIFINGEPQQTLLKKYISDKSGFSGTPAKIKGLLPGEYDLKLELDGYWPWQKKLTIEPGASTYAEDVYLFKKDLPILLAQGEISGTVASPDKNKTAVSTNGQILILNLTGEKQTKLAAPAGAGIVFSWAPSSKKILFGATAVNLEDVENLKTLGINLADFIKTKNEINNIKWDMASDDKLYYQDKNNINSFTLSIKTSQTILEGQQFEDYLIKDNYLYFISRMNGSANLNIFDIGARQLIRTVDLPSSSNFYFINPDRKLLNLYDENHQILYLIDPFSSFYSPLRETINNVKYAYWVNDDKLLYANDFEIWLFDLNANKKTLLTRVSQIITEVIWHPSNNYIIYCAENAVNAIELDERDRYNITEIIKLDKIRFPFLSQKGDILYFYAKIGNQEGLYELSIQ